MAEYVGLRKIGERLGWSPNSVGFAIVNYGLPAYQRRLHGRWRWIIDDDLIMRWKLERAKFFREAAIKRGVYRSTRPNRRMVEDVEGHAPLPSGERCESAA